MLLAHMENLASNIGLESVFILTTQTMHWFQERGFKRTDISILPKQKRNLYNYQRNSKVAVKTLNA